MCVEYRGVPPGEPNKLYCISGKHVHQLNQSTLLL